MKFIFDFDDVLFSTTAKFKPYMYACLEKAGVPRALAEPYYKEVRTNQFWLQELLKNFSLDEKYYEEILNENVLPDFLNKDILNCVYRLGKENCYILTHGGEKFQRDKIKRSGVENLFKEVIVVFAKKTEEVERICKENINEEVLFIDDKKKHFADLDMTKCYNLKTILYEENQPLHFLKV